MPPYAATSGMRPRPISHCLSGSLSTVLENTLPTLKDHVPSGYPYFGSIAQFWGYYRDIWKITRSKYSFNLGYHVMVMVIGSSFSVEYGIKGLYENTVGRVSEWFAGGALTPEDHIAANVAQSYDDFIEFVRG